MSQSYFPSATASAPATPEPTKETSFNPVQKVLAAKGEEVQAAYVGQRDAILGALDGTSEILGDLRTFLKEKWVVRYPTFKPSPPKSATRPSARHALSFADEPHKEFEVDLLTPEAATSSTPPHRTALKRSVTLAPTSSHDDEDSETDERPTPALSTSAPSSPTDKDSLIPTHPSSDFHVLRLDLKLGPHGSSTHPSSLVTQLEKASIANLIDERVSASLSHIAKLRTRIEDTSSKVLVTGDLNAGKSTLVNALLGRDVMPVDQQPCTTLFCDVRDAAEENDAIEEAHLVNEGATYDRADESTFTRVPIDDLEAVVSESDAQRVLKLYLHDPTSPSSAVTSSLLNNGLLSISLIDAPGLNRDSLQTTEVFARQEEIDVVVFVVSAENHFTLSAKEFLFTASKEKAYVFVVVNKFDQIRDKAKCKRMVLDQIRQLSPRTWEDADDLVHFVDSKSALARAAFPSPEQEPLSPPVSTKHAPAAVPAETFAHMESALRNFVLVKRAKSKLMPAVTYIQNVLSDLDILISTNRIVATREMEQASADLARSKPVLEKMKHGRSELEDGLDEIEEEVASGSHDHAKMTLEAALERVGKGEVGVTEELVKAKSSRQHHVKECPALPTYPGILGAWEYAGQVRRVLVSSLELAVVLAEDEARDITAQGVSDMFALAGTHLPNGADRSKRVFVPEAMFSPRRNAKGGAIVAGAVHGLGIGMAQRQELLEVSVFDLLALNHHLARQLGIATGDEDEESTHIVKPSAWGALSLGLGAITMVGGKAMGLRGLIEGAAQIGDILGNERTRRWVAPVLGAAALGATVYLVLELPKTIPRSVGRQIKASLLDADALGLGTGLVTPQLPFPEKHGRRIEREARKVMKLAGWDSRERFRAAMETSQKEVKVAEEGLARASGALVWFEEAEKRADGVREKTAVEGL